MAAPLTYNPVATSKFAKTDKVALATMIIALKSGKAYSYDDLAELTGFSRRTVAEWMVAFRRRKLVRIGAWESDGKRLCGIAKFVWDEELGWPDAPKPKLTRKQMRERYLNKLQTLRVKRLGDKRESVPA